MATEKTSLEESKTLGDARAGATSPKVRRWHFLLPAIVLLVLAGGYFGVQWWLYTLYHVSTDDARVKGTLITVSTEVAGRLVRILIEEGQRVQQGDLLAQIQPDTYEIEVALRTAALEAAHSQLASAEADLALSRTLIEGNVQRSDAVVDVSRSQLAETQKAASLEDQRLQANLREKTAAVEEARARLIGTKASVETAAASLDRIKQLLRDGIVPAERLEQAAAASDQAVAHHQAAQEALHKSEALLQMAHADNQKVQLSQATVRTQQRKVQESETLRELALAERQRVQMKEETVKNLRSKVKETEAQLALARLHLTETRIVSPITGVVSQKIADLGERVQPGQPLVIVNDPQDVWISANIEETDIRKVREGQAVEITVDAYPQRIFHGTVAQTGAATRSEFAIIPSGSSSAHFIKVTQRIPVRIAVDDREELLKPGMMVEVSIRVR
jgi:multidrug resistance efflux pump